MPILELLIFKGASALISAAGIKTIFALAVKAIASFGVANFITATGVTLLVVGAITWTSEAISSLRSAVDHMERGEFALAAIDFAKVAKKLGIGIDELPAAIHDYLGEIDLPSEQIDHITELVKGMKADIEKHL